MKRKILLTGLFLVMLSSAVLAADVTVTRSISDTTPNAGDTVTVTLDVTAAANVTSMGIREYVTAGWGITLISPAASSPLIGRNETAGTIWYMFLDENVEDMTITYELEIPVDASGEYSVTGNVEEEPSGETNDVTGDDTLTVSELTTTTTTTTTTSTTSTTIASGVSVSRDLSASTVRRGGTFTATLDMDVTSDEVSSVEIVENLPIGWNVTLTNNGSADTATFDAGAGTVTYTFSDELVADSTVRYTVTVPSDAVTGRYIINGTANDGTTDSEVTGQDRITVGTSSSSENFVLAVPSALYANQPIKINVTDEDTDDPVEKVGVDVYMGTSKTGKKVAYGMTDKNGSFTFTVTEAGKFIIYLDMSKYKEFKQVITVAEGAPITTTTTLETTTTTKATTTTVAPTTQPIPTTTVAQTTQPVTTTTVETTTTTEPVVTTTTQAGGGGVDSGLILLGVIVLIIIIVVAYFAMQKGKGKPKEAK